jgi:RNA polymerase sigma factor (sigma-70 family)
MKQNQRRIDAAAVAGTGEATGAAIENLAGSGTGIFEDAWTMIEFDPIHFMKMSESELEIFGSNTLKEFPRLTRANCVDGVGFQSNGREGRTASSSIDTRSAYYKSMHRIPLLTREQEIYLAKKIESAKLNILRLLCLTTINSLKVTELSSELEPAAAPRADVCKTDNPDSIEERREKRLLEVNGVLHRIRKLETGYRAAKLRKHRSSALAYNSNRVDNYLEKNREAIFLSCRKIAFTEKQIMILVGSVQELLRRMEEARQKAQADLRELEFQYLTSPTELRKILDLIRENRTEMLYAKDQFVQSNLRLVLSIAKRYSYLKLDFLDIVQEGNIGLMKAVEKFDYRIGNKFSTYATWWIRQSISRAVSDQGRTIRVPSHMVEAYNSVLKASNGLRKRVGREPSTSEIAEELKVPVPKIREILDVPQEPISLETNAAHIEGLILNDLIEDKQAISPHEPVIQDNIRQIMKSVLDTLPSREQEIIRMRYGLNESEKEHTLQECGEKFQVTRERIRQIEEKALAKLRGTCHSNRLREYAYYVSSH